VTAVPAGLSWQLYQEDCLDSCTRRTVVTAVPAGLSWQLYQQTAMPAVPAGLSWQLYQQTAMPAVPAPLPWELYQQDCHAFTVKAVIVIVYRWPGQRFLSARGLGSTLTQLVAIKKRFCQKDLQVEEYLFYASAVSLLLRKHIYFTNSAWHILFKYKHFLGLGALIYYSSKKTKPEFLNF
jgi:hypothetical protein